MNVPEQIYTKKDLQNAETKGQIVGWLQGGAVVVGGWLVVGLIGWIPTILALGGVGYVGYKLLKPSSKES